MSRYEGMSAVELRAALAEDVAELPAGELAVVARVVAALLGDPSLPDRHLRFQNLDPVVFKVRQGGSDAPDQARLGRVLRLVHSDADL